MKFYAALATTTLAALVCAAPAAQASLSRPPLAVHALFSKGPKMIKVNLRNNTGAAFELKVGDAVSSLSPGETKEMKLATGTQVLANTETEHHKIGDVLLTASRGDSGDNVVIINK